MLRILWAGHVSNKEIIKKMGTRRHIFKLRKRQLKLLGHIMKKAGLENVTHMGHERRRSKGKLRVTYLMSSDEWMVEQGQRVMVKSQTLLRATRDRKLWRAIAKILKETVHKR